MDERRGVVDGPHGNVGVLVHKRTERGDSSSLHGRFLGSQALVDEVVIRRKSCPAPVAIPVGRILARFTGRLRCVCL